MARKEVTKPVFYGNKIFFGIPENGLVIYEPSTNKFEQFTRNKRTTE
jgi:hypothetical protein